MFDREEQDRYTVVIQASDNPTAAGSQNQLTDSLVVKVRILDENDNRPECEQDKYFIEVAQNADVGTILTQVKGIDNDLGRNAQLRYFIHALDAPRPSDPVFLSKKKMQTHYVVFISYISSFQPTFCII